jgi:protein SCO1
MLNRFRAGLFAGAAMLLLSVAAGCGSDDGADSQPTATASAADEAGFRGVRVEPPIPKPDFTLTDTDGQEFDIGDETDGFVTLIYLGYTSCPDICPLHMFDIAETLKAMDPEDAEQIKVLFITTDPERDTPEVMRRWLDLFNPGFIGLTADQETLDQLQLAVGATPGRPYDTDRAGEDGYEVSHAAYVMAFAREDNLAHTVYPTLDNATGFGRDAWLNDMTLLVREGWTEE